MSDYATFLSSKLPRVPSVGFSLGTVSPFMGIGSEGYVAVEMGRRFVGTELKPSYYRVAVDNLRRAERAVGGGLFSAIESESVA